MLGLLSGQPGWKCSFSMWWPFCNTLPTDSHSYPFHLRQRPSTLDLVLTNGFHDIFDLSTRTVLSSDHLTVFFKVDLDVRRMVPEHFAFDHINGDWALFRQEIDSLDKVGYEADVDSMVRTFPEAILGARSTAVPLVRSNRYHFTLTFQIKSIIAQKNVHHRAWQRHHNTSIARKEQVLWDSSLETGWAYSHNGVREGRRNSLQIFSGS
jgi:hypothetical protein